MQRNAIILIIFAVVIAAAVALRHLPDSSCATDRPPTAEAIHPTRAGAFRGFSLQLHDHDPDGKVFRLIDAIAETPANIVCFVVHAYQEHAGSSVIFIEARKTPSDKHLGKLIDYAHEKGLQVAVMPVVLLAKRRGDEWRGKIKPGDWDEWWRHYRDIITRYARLAGEHDVEVFSVGSELLSTEKHVERWQELIGEVRRLCDSRLTYSANWDHYQVPAWWDLLDIVGMTCYYKLSGDDDPSLDDLLAAWQPLRKNILDWQRRIDRPILFTEVGWPNQTTAAAKPWNYYAAADSPAPQLQARLFEAFFRTWQDQPGVAGFFVWEWKYRPDQETAPQKDTTYCPVGKPAMDVIRQHYQAAADAAAKDADDDESDGTDPPPVATSQPDQQQNAPSTQPRQEE